MVLLSLGALLLLLSLAAPSPCPFPRPVDQPFPSSFVKENGGQLVRDGNTISCPNYFVGYNGNGKSSFTFGEGPYTCDLATKKWKYQGYAAPEFLSCGTNSTSFQCCGIYDLQESGIKGHIALYPGHEQYCPSNKVIKWMPDGRYVKQITCLGTGELKIVTDNGVFTHGDPVLTCVQAPATQLRATYSPCPLPSPVVQSFPSPLYKDGQLVRDGNTITCPNYFVGNNGNGKNSFTFGGVNEGGTYTCDVATKKWKHADGYAAPDFLSCGTTTSHIECCGIYDLQENGKKGSIALYPGHEQYCPSNKVIKWMPYGRYVKQITCLGGEFKIVTDNGVFTHRDPVFTCVQAPATQLRATYSPCPLPLPVTQSFPWPFNKDVNGGQLLRDGNEISCPYRAHFVGYNGNGKTFTFGGGPYTCDLATKKWMYEGYAAPEFLSCGTNSTSFQCCGIYDLQESGKKGSIALYPGHEQYCPSNKVIKWMPYGRYVKKITCLGGEFKIVTDNGVFTHRDPVFTCVQAPAVQLRATSSSCELPLPVVQSFPWPFNKDVNGGQLLRDGNEISCPYRAHFVGYNGNGKNTFTFGGGPYTCDPATKKWMYEGYAAPEFLSCGTNSTSFEKCGIYDQQESGNKGHISLYPGREQYCPSDKVIKWMPYGRYVKQITCLGEKFKIVTDNGVFTHSDPVFTCVRY